MSSEITFDDYLACKFANKQKREYFDTNILDTV